MGEPNAVEDLDDLADELVDAALSGDSAALKNVISALDSYEEGEPMADEPQPATAKIEILKVYQRKDETPEHAYADAALRPSTRAALTTHSLLRGRLLNGELSINALAEVLGEQVRKVTDRDLDRGEAMLAAQAHTLDAIFNTVLAKALIQEHAPHMEMFYKIALRAQSQCRSTWEAISAIQNPPIAGYVKQANIANNQQINNAAPARTEENQTPPNKLLEQTTHEPDQWLDRRTSTAAARGDSAMETVGKIDGAQNLSRQGNSRA